MILSVHLRKCAGTSFRYSLEQAFGRATHFDYGDQIGSNWPSSIERRKQRAAQARKNAARLIAETKIIHGHFYRNKYDFLDTPKTYVTLMRDPVARVASNYHYLRRLPGRRHPDALIVHALGFSLTEFATYPDNRNLQSHCLQSTDLSEFACVGTVEDFDHSLARLSEVMGTPLPPGPPQNVNETASTDYALTRAERCTIENANLEDLRLYDLARNALARAA